MAEDLSTPLGRKKGQIAPAGAARSRLPLTRIAFGVIVLVLVGVGLRIALVNDPQGGRPVANVGINSTRNVNAIADTVASAVATPGTKATITADPETPVPVLPGGPSITAVDPNTPDGFETANVKVNDKGVFPDLTEKTDTGSIPRIGPDGQTPFAAYSTSADTPDATSGKPQIAIIVTGLGLNEAGTLSAIGQLPDAVTLAFAPYGKTLDRTVGAARAGGHEILLEVPLEPFDFPDNDPGPDTLLTGQAPRDNINKLFNVMSRFGGYIGLVNHMGARFTASAADFGPVMEELGTRGLGYLDDGSSNRSLAPQLAAANQVPFGRADIDLDTNPARASILEALSALEARAADQGSAIGIISALPISVSTLAEWAKTAKDRNFIIVPISALMKKS